ncbi:MAG TPA: precorrin-4 C(11)-methyltransferase [Pseudonocardiaceae bacterium]|nr:precorrin-4 C(11)-methyltransferase [Pseudonocardiaceae bacterium]
MTSGRVSFIGAGPGAADLITLRGAKRIAEADIVVWAASLVDPECVREHARADAELIDSSRITHDDVLDVYRRAFGQQLKVARVHSGDPSLWGAVQEQYDSCVRLGLDVEIVPGVSAFSAAAAIAGRELTVPEVAQSVILTRLEGGKTPMPDGEHIREFARHGTTMAIFLSAARSGQLVDELRAGGYPDDTPVVVAYKVTWPDELILHTTIGELADTVKEHKLWRHTLFLVGKALRAEGTRSHLYHAGHFHTYRKADPVARRALRAVGTEAPDDTTEETTARPKAGGWPLHTSRSGWVAARIGAGGTWTGQNRDSSNQDSTNQDSTNQDNTNQDSTNRDGTAQSAGQSVAAWSAVHGWQETARSASRGGARPSKGGDGSRSVKAVPVDQETLSFESEAATSAPGSDTGAGMGDTSAPAGETRALRVDTQARTVDTPARGVDTPAQGVETSAPAVETRSGVVDTPASMVETSARTVDTPERRVDTPGSTADTPERRGDSGQAAAGQDGPKVEVRAARQGNRKTGAKRGANGRKVAGKSAQPGGQVRRAGQ